MSATTTAIGFTAENQAGLFPCSPSIPVTNRFLRAYGTFPRSFSHEANSSSEFLRSSHCSCLSA
jgi:hypothetical protein